MGCFEKYSWQKEELRYFSLSIPFGMLLNEILGEIPTMKIPFNPFWDASRFALQKSSRRSNTFNPFWDASESANVNYDVIVIAFNPFWDASLIDSSKQAFVLTTLSIPFGMLPVSVFVSQEGSYVNFQSLLGCFLVG